MRRLCGFVLFWMAVGIVIGMFLSSNFVVICLIIAMLIVGFNLFCEKD